MTLDRVNPNEALVVRFYEAFQKLDADAMGACYADDVVFSDPVFPHLEGDRARGMWKMLCHRSRAAGPGALEVTFRDVKADDQRGSAHWEARYPFSKTKRMVHNVIDAAFEFEGGKIRRHTDTFDLWRWSRMALGPLGLVLGWSPVVRGKVRREAASGLDKFLARS